MTAHRTAMQSRGIWGRSMKDEDRGIHELYAEDPVAADDLVWGRKSHSVTRRGFLTRGGIAAMSAAVGASIPFAHLMPGGLIPAGCKALL